MKKIFIGILVFGSMMTYASDAYNVVVCNNVSDHAGDALTVNFYNNTAIYFDNDKDQSIPCAQLKNGITMCSDGHWTIHIPKDGVNTTVFEGRNFERKIPFDCKI